MVNENVNGLNWPVGKEQRRSGRQRLWMVRKSEKVCIKARQKLIAGERKYFKRMARSRTIDCRWSSVCQEQRILDL